MAGNGAMIFEKAVQEDLDIGTGQVDVTNPGGGTIRGTRINIGSLAFATYDADWSPGAVNPSPNNINSVLLSLPGVSLGDMVLVSFAGVALPSYVLVFGYVSATDAVVVTMANLGALVVNPGTAKLRVMVFKHNLT